MTITEIWQKVRETIDRWLKYDPSPPVVIEQDGRRIIISDGLPPEANAMTLAMYSRSPKSFLIHLQEVLTKGWKKFMAQFYVGYGHKSIGDCGSTTICAENVSMLVAKEIQNDPLYNGQEASTRYMDMINQSVLNPLATPEGEAIQARWMRLYHCVLLELVPYLTEKYPILESDKPNIYAKAIQAKAFDIARAFLPAGCTTYVGWHTNLRQAWDHVQEMRFHSLQEVREVAEVMLSGLRQKYPSSFNFKSYPEQNEYLGYCGEFGYFDLAPSQNFWSTHNFRHDLRLIRVLVKRPQKTELPNWVNRHGQIQFRFLLDFGSFRDLQRHRSCTQPMPLLTTHHGFNKWYLESLPEKLRTEALEIMAIQELEISMIESPIVRQYYVAMGYNVSCEVTAGLPSAVYIAELRSGQTVHPTLRLIAQDMGRTLKNIFPEMALHCDFSPDEWSTARGRHDIVKKEH